MDKNAPLCSSRPPSSTSGSIANVTMLRLRHPPWITGAPRKTQTYVPQMNSSRPLSKPDQASPSSARLQQQAHGPSISKSQDPSRDVDVTARLNEFADFLVQFNNTTVVAIDSRLQKMETMVGEHFGRTELALGDQGVQNAVRLDSISRPIRDAVSDTIKQLFSEQEKQTREESLAKSVLTEVMSGLQSRFDQIYRHMEENTKSTSALQASIRSLEERFKKIEEQTSGGFVGSPNAHPVGTSAASLQVPLESGGPMAPAQQHLEEFGHMLDRLASLVDGARDEAHSDKEDLAKHFHRAHHGFALTLNKEMQTLKNAIGIGRGCLKNFKESGSSTTQSSLAEYLESIALDVQELFECFQDSEAAREEEPLAVKHSLEALPNKLSMRHLRRTVCDAAVMTDDNQKASAAIKDVSQTKVIYTDSSVQTSPLPATVDVMTSTDYSHLTETRQASVQASPPATVDVMTSTDSLPSTLDTSTSDSISSTSMEAPVSENVSAITLVDGEFFVPPCSGGNLLPVSSWSMPFPHQWPAPESLPATKLTLDTDMAAMPGVEQSASTVLQLSGVPLDPSTSLLSPPPSSVSRSPSVSLKRKADDVAENVEFSQSMSRPPIEPNAPLAVKQSDDDSIFDLIGSLSPLTPQNDKLVVDLNRSPSPLTPLTSEAEPDSPDDDGDNEIEPEELLPAGDEPVLSSSKDNLSTISQENSIRRVEAAGPFQHWCPNGCMLGYSDKESLNRHVKKCPLVKRSNQNNDSSSTAPAKRRKLDHGRSESSTSPTRPGSSRRRRSEKSKGKAVTHSHPLQALERCDWPPKARVNETFDHQFLQCDRCDSSYHYRCIGVKRGDKRLVPDVEFICPPCAHILGNDPNAGIKKNNSSCCGRPDCEWPGEASNDKEDYFVVEKILGRSVADVNCPQRIYLWLIKWNGYHIKECDWLEESQLPDADALIRVFYSAAAKEGMKLRDDESIYLLREARKVLHLALKGGWKWI